MKRAALILLIAVGCGRVKNEGADAVDFTETEDAASDGGAPEVESPVRGPSDANGPGDVGATLDADDGGLRLPASCTGATTPPTSLVCTGLYADITTKTVAPGVEPYAPAVPLWSDGASKQRWIFLPPGTTIDNTNAEEWVFPVGTKAWKEFSKDGKRVETRLWQKVTATFWVNATYAWNADESVATRSDGGDIPWNGGTYHIPTNDECQKCHRGRNDRLLGFEQGLLGLAGAQGMTLGRLVAEGRLTVPPKSTTLVIGDDGTGLAPPALAWMHVNCGTTCHNRNSNATAWSTGMFLRLDPTELDGRSVKAFDSLTTTIDVPETSPNWPGRTRIVSHDPARSLLYQLISHRGTGNQMPPIATSVVDEADIPLVAAWIEQLPPRMSVPDAAAGEAGATDGGHGETAEDAGAPGVDAPAVDAGVIDAPAADAPAVDAAVVDAGVIDAGADGGTLDAPDADADVGDAPASETD
jgi:hypothetical protein